MSISFSRIPAGARVPLFYVEFDNSMAGVTQTVKRALLIAQTIVTQPATAVYLPSLAMALALYGAGSMLARMVAAFRANDSETELWVLPLADNGSGTAATASLAFTVTGTLAAATLPLYIAGQVIQVALAAGLDATGVATAVTAAINAMASLPCTAVASTGDVNLTARHKGVAAGAIDIRLAYGGTRNGEAMPAGLACAITAFSGGAGDPDLSGVAAALGDVAFDYIGQPYTATTPLDAFKALMSDSAGRWSPTEQIFGHVFTAKVDSVANLHTLGTARNDPHMTIVGIADTPTPAWEIAGAVVGAVNQALSNDPARPVQTLPIMGVLAPPIASRMTKSQQQTLLTSGIALASFDDAGQAYVLRCVTTYQANALGQADQSYLDAETLYTLMEITRRLRAVVTTKFARFKLADDGTPFGPGQPIVTPKIVFGELIAAYQAMMRDGLVENAQAFAKATLVQRNAADPSRLDILFAPYLVSGLRILAVLNQFRLTPA